MYRELWDSQTGDVRKNDSSVEIGNASVPAEGAGDSGNKTNVKEDGDEFTYE